MALTVRIDGLRNQRGLVHLCLTAIEKDYLDCADHPGSVQREMKASAVGEVKMSSLEPGTYYLLVLHDENANGKLDKFLGIPKEGFGFSGNPGLRAGPPEAGQVRFEVKGKAAEQRVKLRYLL